MADIFEDINFITKLNLLINSDYNILAYYNSINNEFINNIYLDSILHKDNRFNKLNKLLHFVNSNNRNIICSNKINNIYNLELLFNKKYLFYNILNIFRNQDIFIINENNEIINKYNLFDNPDNYISILKKIIELFNLYINNNTIDNLNETNIIYDNIIQLIRICILIYTVEFDSNIFNLINDTIIYHDNIFNFKIFDIPYYIILFYKIPKEITLLQYETYFNYILNYNDDKNYHKYNIISELLSYSKYIKLNNYSTFNNFLFTQSESLIVNNYKKNEVFILWLKNGSIDKINYLANNYFNVFCLVNINFIKFDKLINYLLFDNNIDFINFIFESKIISHDINIDLLKYKKIISYLKENYKSYIKYQIQKYDNLDFDKLKNINFYYLKIHLDINLDNIKKYHTKEIDYNNFNIISTENDYFNINNYSIQNNSIIKYKNTRYNKINLIPYIYKFKDIVYKGLLINLFYRSKDIFEFLSIIKTISNNNIYNFISNDIILDDFKEILFNETKDSLIINNFNLFKSTIIILYIKFLTKIKLYNSTHNINDYDILISKIYNAILITSEDFILGNFINFELFEISFVINNDDTIEKTKLKLKTELLFSELKKNSELYNIFDYNKYFNLDEIDFYTILDLLFYYYFIKSNEFKLSCINNIINVILYIQQNYDINFTLLFKKFIFTNYSEYIDYKDYYNLEYELIIQLLNNCININYLNSNNDNIALLFMKSTNTITLSHQLLFDKINKYLLNLKNKDNITTYDYIIELYNKKNCVQKLKAMSIIFKDIDKSNFNFDLKTKIKNCPELIDYITRISINNSNIINDYNCIYCNKLIDIKLVKDDNIFITKNNISLIHSVCFDKIKKSYNQLYKLNISPCLFNNNTPYNIITKLFIKIYDDNCNICNNQDKLIIYNCGHVICISCYLSCLNFYENNDTDFNYKEKIKCHMCRQIQNTNEIILLQ